MGAKIKPNLKDYFTIEIPRIREGHAIPFSLFMHLPLNQRMLHFRREEDLIETGFVEKYNDKKLLYIPLSQKPKYEDYFQNHTKKENAEITVDAEKKIEEKLHEAASGSSQETSEKPEPVYTSDPAKPAPPAEVKPTEEMKSKIGEAIKDLASADEEKRKAAAENCREIAKKIVTNGESETSLFAKLWDAAQDENGSHHSANVATFAVLFSMATQTEDLNTLKDVAFAGLIHDIGLSLVDARLSRGSYSALDATDKAVYETHVGLALQTLAGMNVLPPPKTTAFVSQHHEKFDGTGYPKGLKNWNIENLSQILSVADIFDEMFQGQFDGTKRTITEAFRDIVKIEKSKMFPQYYNPDIFTKLVTWIETNTEEKILEQAQGIVSQVGSEKAAA